MAADDPYKTKWGGDYASDKPGEDPYKTDWGGQHSSDTPDKGVYKTPGNAPSDIHGQPAPKDGAIADNTGKKKAPDREELSQKEKTGADSKFENQVGRGYSAGSNKTSWASKNRRKLLIAGAGSSLVILPLILFLALLLPSLKLPQLAAEIEGYRLARLSRTFYRESSILTADKSFLDASTGAAAEDLTGKTALGRSINTFRPLKVISNMKANGTLGFDYSSAKGGTQRLNAVILNGERINTPDYKYRSLSDLKNHYSERIKFAAQIKVGVDHALNGNNYFVRSATTKSLLRANGINLFWWEKLGSKYKGLTQQAADRLAIREAQAKIEQPTNDLKSGSLKKAVDAAEQAQKDCLANNPCTDKEIATGGLAPEVKDAITKGTTTGTFEKALGLANPVYAVAFPVCIAYDGSANISRQFLNAQNKAALTTFLGVAAASDQIKSGDITAEAASAGNRWVGDIANSIPSQLSAGRQVDTSAEVSPQAGRGGEFTIFSALFPGPLGSFANLLADNICPIATNITAAAGLAVVTTAIALLAPGTEEGVDAAANGVADTVGSRIISQITSVFKGRVTINTFKNTGKDYASSTIKTAGATEGLTYLSRMIVLAEMGSFINGMDSNDIPNQADMGGVAYNSQMNQQQLFGRPMTNTENAAAQTEDNGYIGLQNKNQSAYQRYFAIANPRSLMGNLAMRISGWKFSDAASFFTNIPKIFGTIFSPLSHLALGHAAAATAVNSNYGTVQFGWSADEEKLIDSDPTYDPLVNAQIVADSGQSAAIAKKYAPCFNYTADDQGNLTYNQDEHIGDLLSSGSGSDDAPIVRDGGGNVVPNRGTCSPDNLSYNSSDSLAQDNDSQTKHTQDLVFRWRLDQSYQNTLGELKSVQNVGGVATP